MFDSCEYQLVDFGRGRKLERFGRFLIDRPCLAAADIPTTASEELWGDAAARFDRGKARRGKWSYSGRAPKPWTIRHGPVVLELRPTPFGHLGLFPEQAVVWDRIAAELVEQPKGLRVLNLFAYTGGGTLTAASCGTEVVHVDAARNTVAWSRRNAAVSGLDNARIRWIVEDAPKFARRELKRGRCYEAVILDPPSYGHGPHGQVWAIDEHLRPLLEASAALTEPHRRLIVLSCHTPGYSAGRLGEMLAAALGCGLGEVETMELAIESPAAGRLPSGAAAWWSHHAPRTKAR